MAMLLLLPLAAWAQKSSQAKPQAGQQAAPPADQQDQPQAGQDAGGGDDMAAEAPIEPVLSGPYPVMSKAAEERGRQLYELFNHSEFKAMWAALSDGQRNSMIRRVSRRKPGNASQQQGPTTAQIEEAFVAAYKKIREQLGPETAMVQENMVPHPLAPDTIYSRLSRFANARVPIMFVITVNQKGQIDSFAPPKPLPENIAEGQYAGYEDQNKLKLPFNNEWLVWQGGRSLFDNYSASSDEARFTYEFVYLKDGHLFGGPGGSKIKNSDYFCFGQPVLAPADGEVIRATAGFDDAPPGRPLGDPADGNIVVISHGDSEASMINHLKQNSLKVKRGDKVKQGDVIAECGNSGNGIIPHVHYQLQRRAGTTLPAQFTDYIADGKPVASGEPSKGQYIKNGASTGTKQAASGAAAPDKKASK
jgi:hypothetical protein